ncbi:MAG: hypothetical protein NTV54_15755 [Ignavibacteriales bacterium]|nr:hypothetical protein [Ignavibacteriales bacterium]
MTIIRFSRPFGVHSLCFLLVGLFLLGTFLFGCDSDRSLVPNTHEGRVPDVLAFSGKIDSSATKKYIVQLKWAFDSVRFGTNREVANLRDWEILRSIGDTSFFQSRGRSFFPQFSDSSNEVQLSGKDSLVLFYKVIPAGFTVDKIQFIGKPSDPLLVIIRKW